MCLIILYYWHIICQVGSVYNFLDLFLGVIAIIVTGVFANLVLRQAKIQERDFAYRNKIETFKQLDTYRENYIPKHESLSIIVKSWNNPSSIDFDFDDGGGKYSTQIESLANHFEILSIKQKDLDLDIAVIYEILGEYIFAIMDNTHTKPILKRLKEEDTNRYVHIEELVNRLKEYKNNL